MAAAATGQTAAANGLLWGARARNWADIQEAAGAGAYEPVMRRTGVEAGVRFLDVGCGAGSAAAQAAALGATVSGVDAAEPLLAIARERAPGGDFRLADLEALPFKDGAFDVVTGFNAFQYAGSPVKALAEAKRVTRRGGAVAIAVWGDPTLMQATTLLTALRGLLPPPPPGAPGPFALSEPGALVALAAAAGLEPGPSFDVHSTIEYPDLETAVRGWSSSGVAARAAGVAGEAAVADAHRTALGAFANGAGGYSLSAVFRCLLARA